MKSSVEFLTQRVNRSPYFQGILRAKTLAITCVASLTLLGCQSDGKQAATEAEPSAPTLTAVAPGLMGFETPLIEMNDGPCLPGQKYQQRTLQEPTKIHPAMMDDGSLIDTQLVVRIRERCVPVWDTITGADGKTTQGWTMQTQKLRTYGFPKVPGTVITEKDADDPNSDKIAWSAPGPTFIMHPASKPGLNDGTQFKMRLFNRMPWDDTPHKCNVIEKCNTRGDDAGLNAQGQCKATDPAFGGVPPSVPAQTVNDMVIEPPNCFHGDNSTNFHFHGFHVSPQANKNKKGKVVSYQDNVFLELMPPKPDGKHHMEDHSSMHGSQGDVQYGHADFDVDPLRYTQPPGTHWYHAHKHGSTALQVLNGLIGSFEVRGEFDEQLDAIYNGKLKDRLLVVQQLKEQAPGMGGGARASAMLVNGLANPIVEIAPGEIQRWRFVGATMQASAALNIGFPDTKDGTTPEIRQIAMDGVQFSPENYKCQPMLNNPDCSEEADTTPLNEQTDFNLDPGNRADFLIKAPTTPGTHCMVVSVRSVLMDDLKDKISQRNSMQMKNVDCDIAIEDGAPSFGTLLTMRVTGTPNPMSFPEANYPQEPSYLADIPAVPESKQKDLYYQMYNQGNLQNVQFWISQTKFDPSCFNETLVMDEPEEWTIYNNSTGIQHPFHIHQNPFQLREESSRGTYKYPIWRDTLALPKAPGNTTPLPNSDPSKWGYAKIRYVAKEFTGPFVNHCHILGHEDRGMMHATQAVCDNGDWARTGPVMDPATCDSEGFCESDCQRNDGKPVYFPAAPQCKAPPRQDGTWPEAYGIKLPK